MAANPAKAVPSLREGRTKGARGTVLTPDQLGLFLATGERLVAEEKLASVLFAMIAMLALCGMRFGEVAAAEWGDLRDGMLHIERSVWHRHVGTTKTDDPRVVPVPEMSLRLLQVQRQRLLAMQHPALSLGLMFPSDPKTATIGAKRRGTTELNWYRYPSSLNVPIRKIVDASDLPRVSPHSFRRTWENVLRRAGVDQMVRRAMAGWRSERAQAIYSEVDLDEAKLEADRAARIVLGGQG